MGLQFWGELLIWGFFPHLEGQSLIWGSVRVFGECHPLGGQIQSFGGGSHSFGGDLRGFGSIVGFWGESLIFGRTTRLGEHRFGATSLILGSIAQSGGELLIWAKRWGEESFLGDPLKKKITILED